MSWEVCVRAWPREREFQSVLAPSMEGLVLLFPSCQEVWAQSAGLFRWGLAGPEWGISLQGALTFIIPFQLSPVETRKRVRKAMPKFRKVACRPRPSQGCVSSHSARGKGREARVSPGGSASLALPPPPSPPQLTQVSKELHAQSCKDEKQQHEEKSQVPHLEKRKRNGEGAARPPRLLP